MLTPSPTKYPRAAPKEATPPLPQEIEQQLWNAKETKVRLEGNEIEEKSRLDTVIEEEKCELPPNATSHSKVQQTGQRRWWNKELGTKKEISVQQTEAELEQAKVVLAQAQAIKNGA